jgi:hypothetical protein
VAAFLFRCTTTGAQTQGWIDDATHAEIGEDDYISISCVACGLAHMINPKTGRVIGGSEEAE